MNDKVIKVVAVIMLIATVLGFFSLLINIF